MRKRIRTGILTVGGAFFTYERCNKHGKVWEEGSNFERCGGKACEECIAKSRPTRYRTKSLEMKT